MVLIEAAAAGIPVICAEHIDRQLTVRVAAATFTSDSVEAAVQALLRTTAHYPDAVANARANSAAVADAYDIRNTATRYCDVLRNVSSGPHPAIPGQTRGI
jgi:glycosyltransferase involved in cell wall biosynthesis